MTPYKYLNLNYLINKCANNKEDFIIVIEYI